MSGTSEWFGESVGEHVGSRYVLYVKSVVLNYVIHVQNDNV